MAGLRFRIGRGGIAPIPPFRRARTGDPSLAEGEAMVGGRAVIDGIAQGKNLTQASAIQLAAEIQGMRVAMGDKGWLLCPGCTFPPETPEANLRAIRDAVEAGVY